MALYVNTNVSAIDAANNLSTTERALERSTQQLSSGLRINSAADDAAGLTISESLQGQINGADQANRNTQDGVSLVQTAAGALTQVQQMLQRIRELAVQYANGTLDGTDQTAILTEVNQLLSEIEKIGASTQFNGVTVLTTSATITFQVGANDGETISIATLSLGAIANVASAFSANSGGGSGGGGSGSYTQSEIQNAYEQAFASISATNDGAPPANVSYNGNVPSDQTYGAESNVGYNSTVGSNDSFGSGSTIGYDSTVGNNDSFGPSSSIEYGTHVGTDAVVGSGSNVDYNTQFGAGAVFGDNVNFGYGITFGADTVFGANDTFAYNDTFGNNSAFGPGDTFSYGESFGSGHASTPAGDPTDIENASGTGSWALFLQSAGNVSSMSSAQLDTAITTFLGSVSEPGADVTQFLSSFHTALASSSSGGGTVSISAIDAAINAVSGAASTFGAVQNRLQHTMANLSTTSENLTAANSRITDVDMASVMTTFTSQQVLQQAGTAMLSQAQKLPDAVLVLLQGV